MTQQYTTFHQKFLHVNCLCDGLFMHNNIFLIRKRGAVDPIPDYMIPVGCCTKKQCVIYPTTDKMISKFESFTNHKLDILFLNEITIK